MTERSGPTSPEPIVAVLMLPDHYKAYCDWLYESKLKTGRLPWPGSFDGLQFHIVTPAHNHPAGKSSR